MRLLTNADIGDRVAEARSLIPAWFDQDEDLDPRVSSETYLYYPGKKDEASVLAELSLLVPFGLDRLLEPFAGSCGFTTAFGPRFVHVEVSDYNADIMTAHALAAGDPEWFIDALKPLFGPETNNAAHYKVVRDRHRSGTLDPIQSALLLVWLNLRAWHGLMRYSSLGFCVSFQDGRPDELDEDEIRAFASRLGNTYFRSGDFREMCGDAGEGDLLYLDPPYLPLDGKSDKDNFTKYSTAFGEKDHVDLARLAKAARDRGAYVLLSNHDSVFARKLYTEHGANLIRPVSVKRSMGKGKGKVKKTAPEIIVCWEPDAKADPPAYVGLPFLSGKSRARAVVEVVRRGADMPSLTGDPDEVFEALRLVETALGRARGRIKTRALSEIARIARAEGISGEDLPWARKTI